MFQNLESIIEIERRRGWSLTLQSKQTGCVALMEPFEGNEEWPAGRAYPTAKGDNATIAVTLALRNRDQVVGRKAAQSCTRC